MTSNLNHLQTCVSGSWGRIEVTVRREHVTTKLNHLQRPIVHIYILFLFGSHVCTYTHTHIRTAHIEREITHYTGDVVHKNHNIIKQMKAQERQEQRWGKNKQTKQTLYAKRVPTQEKKFF